MKRQASDLSQQRRGEHDSPNGSCFLSTGQPASGLPRGSTPRSAAWRRQLCFVNLSGKFSPSARPCRAVDKLCLNSVCLHIFLNTWYSILNINYHSWQQNHAVSLPLGAQQLVPGQVSGPSPCWTSVSQMDQPSWPLAELMEGLMWLE